jgi:hypothetical protein
VITAKVKEEKDEFFTDNPTSVIGTVSERHNKVLSVMDLKENGVEFINRIMCFRTESYRKFELLKKGDFFDYIRKRKL